MNIKKLVGVCLSVLILSGCAIKRETIVTSDMSALLTEEYERALTNLPISQLKRTAFKESPLFHSTITYGKGSDLHAKESRLLYSKSNINLIQSNVISNNEDNISDDPYYSEHSIREQITGYYGFLYLASRDSQVWKKGKVYTNRIGYIDSLKIANGALWRPDNFRTELEFTYFFTIKSKHRYSKDHIARYPFAQRIKTIGWTNIDNMRGGYFELNGESHDFTTARWSHLGMFGKVFFVEMLGAPTRQNLRNGNHSERIICAVPEEIMYVTHCVASYEAKYQVQDSKNALFGSVLGLDTGKTKYGNPEIADNLGELGFYTPIYKTNIMDNQAPGLLGAAILGAASGYSKGKAINAGAIATPNGELIWPSSNVGMYSKGEFNPTCFENLVFDEVDGKC